VRYREMSRSFSFAFLTPSFGLVEAPSSQHSTCIIVIACFAAGSRAARADNGRQCVHRPGELGLVEATEAQHQPLSPRAARIAR
jgi:hypothetical protein